MSNRSKELVELYREMQRVRDESIASDSRLVPVTSVREEQYDRFVAQAKAIFLDRNSKYGDAITETGVLGAVVAMAGDYGRLKNMVIKSPDHGRGQSNEVLDKLIDNLNQVIIAIMMIEENNWEGR